MLRLFCALFVSFLSASVVTPTRSIASVARLLYSNLNNPTQYGTYLDNLKASLATRLSSDVLDADLAIAEQLREAHSQSLLDASLEINPDLVSSTRAAVESLLDVLGREDALLVRINALISDITAGTDTPLQREAFRDSLPAEDAPEMTSRVRSRLAELDRLLLLPPSSPPLPPPSATASPQPWRTSEGRWMLGNVCLLVHDSRGEDLQPLLAELRTAAEIHPELIPLIEHHIPELQASLALIYSDFEHRFERFFASRNRCFAWPEDRDLVDTEIASRGFKELLPEEPLSRLTAEAETLSSGIDQELRSLGSIPVLGGEERVLQMKISTYVNFQLAAEGSGISDSLSSLVQKMNDLVRIRGLMNPRRNSLERQTQDIRSAKLLGNVEEVARTVGEVRRSFENVVASFAQASEAAGEIVGRNFLMIEAWTRLVEEMNTEISEMEEWLITPIYTGDLCIQIFDHGHGEAGRMIGGEFAALNSLVREIDHLANERLSRDDCWKWPEDFIFDNVKIFPGFARPMNGAQIAEFLEAAFVEFLGSGSGLEISVSTAKNHIQASHDQVHENVIALTAFLGEVATVSGRIDQIATKTSELRDFFAQQLEYFNNAPGRAKAQSRRHRSGEVNRRSPELEAEIAAAEVLVRELTGVILKATVDWKQTIENFFAEKLARMQEAIDSAQSQLDAATEALMETEEEARQRERMRQQLTAEVRVEAEDIRKAIRAALGTANVDYANLTRTIKRRFDEITKKTVKMSRPVPESHTDEAIDGALSEVHALLVLAEKLQASDEAISVLIPFSASFVKMADAYRSQLRRTNADKEILVKALQRDISRMEKHMKQLKKAEKKHKRWLEESSTGETIETDVFGVFEANRAAIRDEAASFQKEIDGVHALLKELQPQSEAAGESNRAWVIYVIAAVGVVVVLALVVFLIHYRRYKA